MKIKTKNILIFIKLPLLWVYITKNIIGIYNKKK